MCINKMFRRGLLLPGLLILAVGHAQTTPLDAECISQSNFNGGTYIINAPGKYKLCEDIEFSPSESNGMGNPAENLFDPNFDIYDSNAFGLGFFAAIAITTSDVELYLDGHTIKQSAAHALFQRFFAVIELAASPFLKSIGPAQFVGENENFSAASNVKIIGPGKIGLSSHHGIHGNENSMIEIRDITFEDFEVAAVSLNNVDTLHIENCNVIKNRQDVPVIGAFSAARQIRPYGKALKEMNFEMQLRGEMTSAADVYDKLINSINNVYTDVMKDGAIDEAKHPDEFRLFNNPFRVIDGPCYVFLVHGRGPAVGGQGFEVPTDETIQSSNIIIRNNTISNIKCWTNEVPAAVENGAVMNDARGAVLQFVNTLDNTPLAIGADGKYVGNVVSDMQIMAAKAIINGELVGIPERQTQTNTINARIVEWAEAAAESENSHYSPSYRCNGDSMHHVNKGMAMIRVEDTKGFEIEGNTIDNVRNLSVAPFGGIFAVCTDYHGGASVENQEEQQAGNIRAISVAAVEGFSKSPPKRSLISSNAISNVDSANANVIIGIDVQGESRGIEIETNKVNLKTSVGTDTGDKYMAIRVRQFVDGTGSDSVIVRDDNVLEQETLILNRRHLRKETMTNYPHHNIHASGKSEWDIGGCPFAHAQGYKTD